MTTKPSPRLRVTRIDRVVAGVAGLAGVIALGLFISFVTTPDVTSRNSRAAINTWLRDPATPAHVHLALSIGGLTYVSFVVFLAGVGRISRAWDPDGPWPTVALMGFGLFLAGAVASDAFEWAVPLTLRSAPGLTPDPAVVALLDRGWLVALSEAQLALAVGIGAVTVTAWRARRRGELVPIALIVLGTIGAAAGIPLMLASIVQPVALASNLLRLLWIVVIAIWMIARSGGAASSSSSTTTPGVLLERDDSGGRSSLVS